ncbi:MAG: carotenoid biosynthesis protein [Acidimicrobiales bacterium]
MTPTQIAGTVVGRWYVMALGLAFLWRASRHLGWRRTVTYLVAATLIGALAENASVHTGVPYTSYTFDAALRPKELFIGDVPLIVPLSYSFLGYFGFAAGRMVASGPWRTRARHVWQEYLLGVVLTVWSIWIFDPVSRLGQRWFLGDLFHYRGPGFWFGLPAGSQAGFALVSAMLIGLLTWMARREPDAALATWRRHPDLVSLVTYHAVIAWLAVVALVLGADELGGSAVLMWVPAAAATAVTWSSLRPSPVSRTPAEVSPP